jgi:hypothetical protein
MSARFSRIAGTLALVASGLWLVALIIFGFGLGLTEDFDTTVYLIWSVSILAAGVLTFIATLGLRQRRGNFGGLGTTGVVVLGVGVGVSVLTWATPLWMIIQGVGMLLVVLSMRPISVGPRTALFAYGSGMLIGAITFFVLTAMKVGTPDSYGDYPLAWVFGLIVGLIIVAGGLLGMGRWLNSEQPADANISDHPLTT